jgi:phosphoribosylformimino-5-aminoimidazole carboxamide ribotide isomerase
MEVIPAIDLRDGRCVRLYQGDYSREQVFSDDPVEVARRWEELGAPRLHIVDLDGAATGRPGNLEVIGAIAAQATVPLQVGGGVRDLETAARLVEMGASRVVLGTAAVEEPALVAAALERLGPEAVVVSVDARDGQVALRGWREQSQVSALALLQEMTLLGVVRFIYTDIAQDGTLTEPNFSALAELLPLVSRPLLVAGGVSSLAHLHRLAQLGAEGAIVGMALYTGAIDLPQALQSLA